MMKTLRITELSAVLEQKCSNQTKHLPSVINSSDQLSLTWATISVMTLLFKAERQAWIEWTPRQKENLSLFRTADTQRLQLVWPLQPLDTQTISRFFCKLKHVPWRQAATWRTSNVRKQPDKACVLNHQLSTHLINSPSLLRRAMKNEQLKSELVSCGVRHQSRDEADATDLGYVTFSLQI